MAEHNDLGKKGEELAISFLEKKGFVLLEKNWRLRKAEVDIIARKEDLLIAVEVKTRSTVDFGNPQDFVNPKKIKLLVAAIDNYVCERELDVQVRFDIIAVVHKNSQFEIEHLEDAFLYF